MDIAENHAQTSIQIVEHFQSHPLEYLRHMTMTLANIQSSEELESLIEDFLKPESLALLETNQEMMLILAYVWTSTVRRVVFEPSNIIFPNLLLLFPPIYHDLAWTDDQNTEWNNVHNETLARFESGSQYDDAIMLLFLEGMKYSLYDAMFMFKSRAVLLKRSVDREKAKSLEWELQQYGWPAVELRYLA